MNLITSKEKALSALKRSTTTGVVIKRFSPELRDDFDVVMEAVSIHGYRLESASERLSNNLEIVKKAVEKNQLAFKFAGAEIKKNKEFILDVLKPWFNSGEIFKYCDPYLKNDRKFFIDFIKKNPYALNYTTQFKNDREIALLALQSSKGSFPCIKKSLRDDIELTKIALSDPHNFVHVSKEFKNNEEIALFAINNLKANDGVSFFKEMGPDLKNNKDFFTKIIPINPLLFQHASEKLKHDCDLLKIVLEKFVYKIDYEYSNSKELITPQIYKNPLLLKFATQEILNDRKIILNLLTKNLDHIVYASEEIKNMLGKDRNGFIPKLTKIIEIESLAEKLDVSLNKNEYTSVNKKKL